MLTSATCLKVIGAPELERDMKLWFIEPEYRINAIPAKIYCNIRMIAPLRAALKNIKTRGLQDEIKTFDGCFNIRKKKAGSSPSLHSWGLAIDINAAWNGYNKPVTMSKELLDCFRDTGLFDLGADWTIKDGMHIQLKGLT